MATEFKNIAIIGRPDDERVVGPMSTLVDHLNSRGVNVYAATGASYDLDVNVVEESDIVDHADLMIAIGGDGTMLYAAGLARGNGTPLLGINRGRLGFLADVTPDEMISSVDNVLSGNYSRDERMLLKADLACADREDCSALALNDIVLQRRETGRMVDFETWIGDRYINTHSGDGLIIATPTGSTAYSLSCGGPIIEPRLEALVLVPVAPHTLTDRPIVIPANQAIEIRLVERDDTKAEIMVDGRSLGEILPGDTLTIGPSGGRITMIHPPGYDYYEILRSKLFWGRDLRTRGAPE